MAPVPAIREGLLGLLGLANGHASIDLLCVTHSLSNLRGTDA